jgi:hypothetical protein
MCYDGDEENDNHSEAVIPNAKQWYSAFLYDAACDEFRT